MAPNMRFSQGLHKPLQLLQKLKPILRDNNKPLGSKMKLMRSLVISIFLYACGSWTLTAQLLNILYKVHVTNEEVCRKIQASIKAYGELLTLVKKRKLRWFGYVSRSSGLAKTIIWGTVKGQRKTDRLTDRKSGKTISKSGQEWTLPAQLGQLKTGYGRKGLLRIHLWCPDDHPWLWDRIP